MKHVWTILLLCIFVGLMIRVEDASATTGNDLVAQCSKSANAFNYGQCVGYFKATIAARDEICPPANATVGQAIDMTLAQLAKHPEVRHELGWMLITSALVTSGWKCPDRPRAPGTRSM